MTDRKTHIGHLAIFIGFLIGASSLFGSIHKAEKTADPDEAGLQKRVKELAAQLEEAQAQLAAVRAGKPEGRVGEENALENTSGVLPAAEDGKIRLGPLKIGGAIRANYVIGDYDDAGHPSRGGDGGDFELDTFRLNADLEAGKWIGSAEYRWYNGYNFAHHLWLGYEDGANRVEAGLARVPFGPGPYGISQSWFFDQHYYAGLSDDMDLGVTYTRRFSSFTLDAAWFLRSEWNGNGSSRNGARYSYDVVPDENGVGYKENNQFNLRGIWHVDGGGSGLATDLGASVQYGFLDGKGGLDDGHHYAASLHMVNRLGQWTLATQVTRYEYSLDGGADLVPMGAYDWVADVAAKAWIAGISLSCQLDTPGIPWLDYVLPYVEYSSIIKDEDRFNNSDMVVIGAAWASGGWYIYTDLAFSNGNFFVGDTGDFGANTDNDWQTRFNINFGYYF